MMCGISAINSYCILRRCLPQAVPLVRMLVLRGIFYTCEQLLLCLFAGVHSKICRVTGFALWDVTGFVAVSISQTLFFSYGNGAAIYWNRDEMIVFICLGNHCKRMIMRIDLRLPWQKIRTLALCNSYFQLMLHSEMVLTSVLFLTTKYDTWHHYWNIFLIIGS